MDYLIRKEEIELIQDQLEDIGKLSLELIKRQEQISKDEVWENAVKINKLGQYLYRKLSNLPKR